MQRQNCHLLPIPKTGSGKSWQPVALAGATGQVVQIGSIRGVYVTWKRTRLFREASEGAANPKPFPNQLEP